MKIFIIATLVIMSCLFVLAQQQNSKFTSQNNTEFAKTISDKNVQIVDVRTPREYSAGHIANALNIDVKSSSFDNDILKLDKARPIALYCRSGARSKVAAKKLADKGFTVYELNKGISNWNGETIIK